MNRKTALTWLLLSAFVGLLLVGCSGGTSATPMTYEGKWKRILEVMQEINEVLDGVKDETSSKAAAPKLDKLVAEYNRLDVAIESSGAGSMEEMTRIQKEYMNPLMGELGKFAAHSIRVQFDPKLEATRDAIAELNNNNK